jgi:hypothetical protein
MLVHLATVDLEALAELHVGFGDEFLAGGFRVACGSATAGRWIGGAVIPVQR